MIKIQDSHYSQVTKIALLASLGVLNFCFFVYFVVLVIKVLSDEPGNHSIDIEVSCWVIALISCVFLLTAIGYTIVKLKKMYPVDDNPEATKIKCIAFCFGLSFITKTVYEWAMFIVYKNGD